MLKHAELQIVLSQEPVDSEASSTHSTSKAPSVQSTESLKLISQTKLVPRKYVYDHSSSNIC